MFHLVYTSHSVSPLSQAELIQLLEECRSFNKKNNISGMLLYLEGKFIQVLEGKKQEVKKLYDNIVKDTRHKRVIVVMEGNSSKRIFNGWSMGFKKLSHTEFINLTAFHDIDIFFQKQELQENSHLLLVFLKLFYKKNIVDYSEA